MLTKEVKRLLAAHNIKPRKAYGQHFAVDGTLLYKMCKYADVKSDDIVLEIGAGLGFLTEELSKRAQRVVAVEIDNKLVEVLRTKFSRVPNVDIIQGDFLEINVPPFTKVVSNPPYSISSGILFKLTSYEFKCAVLTFQEEFARRIIAKTGTDSYGRLTVMAYYFYEAELLDIVPRSCFYPAPDVNSIIVRVKPRKTPPFALNDFGFFENFVKWIFTQRKRIARKGIKVALERGMNMDKEEVNNVLDKLIKRFPSIAEKRVYEIAPHELADIANFICFELGDRNAVN